MLRLFRYIIKLPFLNYFVNKSGYAMCDMEIIWSNSSPPLDWAKDDPATSNPVEEVTGEELLKNSQKFPIKFPIETVRYRVLKNKVLNGENLKRNLNSVYPVLHEKSLQLFVQFLQHKRQYGTALEQALYQNLSVGQFVDRLLKKRAVAFLGRQDSGLLLNGMEVRGNWETIGTPKEKEPLTLENCLSYDEIKLSALLSVSSYTYFVNVGDRYNEGELEKNREKVEEDGVIIGLIGARLEKRNVMEYQDMVVSEEQNVPENGYGELEKPSLQKIVSDFYGEPCLTFRELHPQMEENPEKYQKLGPDVYFNNLIYERRLILSIDTLLIEANERAKERGVQAYVHVVGIGLGVWKLSRHQDQIFMDTFAKRIRDLSSSLSNVSDVCFAYSSCNSCGKYKDGDLVPMEEHPSKGVKIHIFDREPHEKLKELDQGKLLVVSYAWDGNALPGNEFWLGLLSDSGDPAAASSTQIAELHNPHINSKVSGSNLRIATLKHGVVPFNQYKKMGNKKDLEHKL